MSSLHKFLFEGLPVRGVLVRLTDAWQELLRRRGSEGTYAPEVQAVLGEMTAAGLLMQANIKFDGAVLVQLHGSGPMKLAVVEVQPDLAFRSTATVVGRVPDGGQLQALVDPQGAGRCAITLDPRQKLPGQVPYQGVVGLKGDRGEPLQQIGDVLEHYMLQSEQLDTRLILAADGEVAAGLLIQRMPVQGEANLEGGQGRPGNEDGIGCSEAYNRIGLLAATLTRDELLSLPPERILHRLFWEETVRVFDPQTPRFACTCSRERVMGMLRSLGREESQSLIEERGEVEVGCEFCGLKYRFDAVDVGEMFTIPRDQMPGSGSVQ